MAEILVGRQPIFNNYLQVDAYELLFRSAGSGNQARFVDGDQATTEVILNSFSEIGLADLVGDKRIFINATRNFLTGKYPIPIPPDKLVLEVLEDITIDKELVAALKDFAARGYHIALDDVVSLKRIQPLLGIAKTIKVDLLSIDRTGLPALVQSLKRYKINLLAEKVETQKELKFCKHLGFTYFQGYFLCKPNIVKGRRLDTSRLVILQSLAKLQDPQINFQDLEQIIAQDVSLGYKLLKLVNSAHYAVREPVKSISQAVSFIGLEQLRGWMTLLLLSAIPNKPRELTNIAMSRAKMGEILARSIGVGPVESYFMVGLFSVLDALVDMPMQQAIAHLPIAEDITNALLHRTGRMGEVLEVIIAHEKGDWDNMPKLVIDPAVVQGSYMKAVKWAGSFLEPAASSDK